jgi:hypothetical protein
MSQKSETDAALKHDENKEGKKELRTFAFDNNLPSLPVPNLEKTLNKYLDSVKPFVDDLTFLKTQSIVEKFRNGIGSVLHFHLLERARTERNWVRKNFIRFFFLYRKYKPFYLFIKA